MVDAQVFISYSRLDQERVFAFADRLRAAKVSVWIDQGGIDAAFKWSQEIVQAIEKCKIFLLVASKTSFASENVVKEVSLASEGGKHILPVYLEPLTPPASIRYQLAGIQHVELFGKNEESAFESILRSLERLGVGSEGVPAPVAPVAAKRRLIGRAAALAVVLAAFAYGTHRFVLADDSDAYVQLRVPEGVEVDGARLQLWERLADGEGELIAERSLASDVEALPFDEEELRGEPPAREDGTPIEALLLNDEEGLLARQTFTLGEGPDELALDATPSILVRLPIGWWDIEGKVVELKRGEETIAKKAVDDLAAVLFGPNAAGIGLLEVEWIKDRKFVKAVENPDKSLEAAKRRELIARWRDPVIHQLEASIVAGDEIEALMRVTGPDGEEKIKAAGLFTVSKLALQDWLMKEQ